MRGRFEIMIISLYFYSSPRFEYSSLFCQKTEIASGIPFGVYVLPSLSRALSLSLSFSHFEIMQDYISIFFRLKYKTLLLHFLSLSVSQCWSLVTPAQEWQL